MADPVSQSSSSSDAHFQQTHKDIVDFQTIFLPKHWSMQKKATSLISQWSYQGQLGLLPVHISPLLLSLIKLFVSFCFEEMVVGALQILGAQKVEGVLWRSSEELRILRENSWSNRIRLHKFNCFMKLFLSHNYILIIFYYRPGERRACTEWWLMQYI